MQQEGNADPHADRAAVEAPHREPALERSRQRASGCSLGALPNDLSARGRSRRVRAEPERVAGENELPRHRRREQHERHDGDRLDGRLAGLGAAARPGFLAEARHASRVPLGRERDNARELRKRYS
jgi:hypothetical protein